MLGNKFDRQVKATKEQGKKTATIKEQEYNLVEVLQVFQQKSLDLIKDKTLEDNLNQESEGE